MLPKVAICVGTRPDVIKLFPVWEALHKHEDKVETFLYHTTQHDRMGLQALEVFNMTPNFIFDMNYDDRIKLGYLSSQLLRKFTYCFEYLQPDLVIVHGDTVTAMSGALAAFQLNIPIGHVEAGLRTSRYETPFPEEGYRRMISRITKLHFAPTQRSAMNLRQEGINKHVYVTGNTVVDSLKYILSYSDSPKIRGLKPYFDNYKFVLVTCHRRESYGEPLKRLCFALESLAKSDDNIVVYWPVHNNTRVSDIVRSSITHERVLLDEPAEYNDFIQMLKSAKLVITDSGGVLEESAVVGRPTLVLRSETERPEVLDLSNVRLVGYDMPEMLELAKSWLVTPPKSEASSVFGDGTAGADVAEIIVKWFEERKINGRDQNLQ